MNIQAPAVMPKWDWALSQSDKDLMAWWGKTIMENAMAEAKKRGTWVNIYWDAQKKEAVFGHDMPLEQIGQADAHNANLGEMKKYYAQKYLC